MEAVACPPSYRWGSFRGPGDLTPAPSPRVQQFKDSMSVPLQGEASLPTQGRLPGVTARVRHFVLCTRISVLGGG